MAVAAKTYTRHTPENTVLYRSVAENFEAFRRDVHERGKSLPVYVEREFDAYLACGRLENGCVRLKCGDCGHEKLLAFSCKRRGFCPSCCGRRMNEAELRLVDEVFPRQPVRQWVLSIPIPLRFLCSRNRPLINQLVRIFSGAVEKLIRAKLRSRSIRKSQSGGVVFIQRLGGALNLNVHFHAIFLDGAYSECPETDKLLFHGLAGDLRSEDIAATVKKIALRAIKMLRKEGLLDDEAGDSEPDGIGLCDGASIKNMIAYGARAGQRVRRLRLNVSGTEPVIRGELVAEMHGFNLKADKLVKAHQRWKLARLVRYVARPPIAVDRLVSSDDGKSVRYLMKNPWSDGTQEILLSGIELIEKLAAAVPPPRGHLVRYFGVLAPNAAWRRHVVLVPKPKARDATGKLQASVTQRASWARLASRAFGLDLTKCELCGGPVRRIAVIHNPISIARILAHIARPPPSRDASGSDAASCL
jgi:hypothetical protein